MKKLFYNLHASIENWSLKQLTQNTYKDIRLCDINHDKTDDELFIAKTKEALDLVEQFDSRRFRRIQKEIHYIVNKELNEMGEYHEDSKSCFIDFGRYLFDTHPEWSLHLYAGVLVHEATHGLLYSKGIPYSIDTREQIERICHREQCRFFDRISSKWKQYLINDFDPSQWHSSWHSSRWTKALSLIKRIRESKRMANKHERQINSKT